MVSLIFALPNLTVDLVALWSDSTRVLGGNSEFERKSSYNNRYVS